MKSQHGWLTWDSERHGSGLRLEAFFYVGMHKILEGFVLLLDLFRTRRGLVSFQG